MDTTQFAMIEELASLIKDNLYSKHLIISTEETLVALLEHQYHDDDDDEDEDDHHNTKAVHHGAVGNTIELQPTSPYNRLLLHRLADIFGFAHESVGEGDDRHLVLQRCPETAIPPVLVSDVLWKYDDGDGDAAFTSIVLTKNVTDLRKSGEQEDVQEAVSIEGLHLKTDPDLKPSQQQSVPLSAASLKEREAAYRAARERIFSTNEANGKNTSVSKSRHVPAVAQRMIAHALGKRVDNPTESDTLVLVKDKGNELVNGCNISTSSRNNLYVVTPGSRVGGYAGKGKSTTPGAGSHGNPSTQNCRTSTVSAEKLKREQIGAAKRMFANALRLPGVEGSDFAARKPK